MKRRGLGKRTIALREAILDVLERFDGPMSSRQVAYQLVPHVIENTESEKERVGRVIVQMRREGLIPYRRIVDRTRARHQRASWDGVLDIMESAAAGYRRNLWADQPIIPMVALEKRALEGVFSTVVDEYGVSLWTFGGYNSESFDFEFAEAITDITDTGRSVVIIYFGDHDPSGLDIERATVERLRRFGAQFEWQRVGLLAEDFDAFNLARVPVKPTDTRAKVFLSKFGDRAAEVDALPPDILGRRIRAAVETFIEPTAWESLRAAEAAEKEALETVMGNWDAAVAAARTAA